MSDSKRDSTPQPAATGPAAPLRSYEPPRIEKLGSLRDLLAAKTVVTIDGPNNPGKH